MTYLEPIGVITGLLSVWLATRQNWLTWPIGITNLVCFAFMFAENHLYSDVCLHVIYLWLSIYGWAKWGTKHERSVVRASDGLYSVLGLVIWSIGIAYPVSLLLARFTNASFPFLDSFVMIMSIFACWWMSVKILESWIVYIISDLVAICIYLAKGLDMTVGLYFVYLCLCVSGYIRWKKTTGLCII